MQEQKKIHPSLGSNYCWLKLNYHTTHSVIKLQTCLFSFFLSIFLPSLSLSFSFLFLIRLFYLSPFYYFFLVFSLFISFFLSFFLSLLFITSFSMFCFLPFHLAHLYINFLPSHLPFQS